MKLKDLFETKFTRSKAKEIYDGYWNFMDDENTQLEDKKVADDWLKDQKQEVLNQLESEEEKQDFLKELKSLFRFGTIDHQQSLF